MFTLGLIYAVMYLFIFLSLLVLSFLHFPILFLTQLSTTNFLVILQKYSRVKNLFLLLIFALTGLPPVGLFFVKFNILAFVLYQTHITAVIMLFLVFLLNMLFYIQLFNAKNYKKPVYSTLNPEVFKIWQQNQLGKAPSSSYVTYKLTLFTVNTLLLLLLTPLFFSDIFLILSLV